MDSVLFLTTAITTSPCPQFSFLTSLRSATPTFPSLTRRFNGFASARLSCLRSALTGGALTADPVPPKNGVYTVGEFMTRKEDLHVVKPTTTIDEALETLVEKRITGFPVIDDDWKLVGLASDYDLLALDSISGGGQTNTSMFPEVDSTWKTFNEIQKLLSKTNGKVIGDVMTPAPLVVGESTNLEDVARLLLETKYRRIPVIDEDGKLACFILQGRNHNEGQCYQSRPTNQTQNGKSRIIMNSM
ncbi:hypothetical protein Sjap_022861 [Stephania japonica]|uniref:CBS domain-containing protein n=1 Tax=Stephania japonica TaxID=461633 RepID=A0AAP0HTF3_9MAGN